MRFAAPKARHGGKPGPSPRYRDASYLEATVQGSSLHARSLLDGSVLRVGQLQPGRLRNGVVALIVGVAIGVLLVSQWQSPAASVATGRQHFTQQTIDRLE